jgi:transaldolase
MKSLAQLKVAIYADGADLVGIDELSRKPYIKGITTNPTLMRQAGIADYLEFAKDLLARVTNKPVSLEVFADELHEMRRQALVLAELGSNVFVKLPITNTRAESTLPIARDLSRQGVQLNLTALLTLEQVKATAEALDPETAAIVSVFAGRIADSGIDPQPIMREAKALLAKRPKALLLWASVREVLNIMQAEMCGCDIVTVTHDILAKAERMLGIDHISLSLDTVRMFAKDAAAAGYKL